MADTEAFNSKTQGLKQENQNLILSVLELKASVSAMANQDASQSQATTGKLQTSDFKLMEERDALLKEKAQMEEVIEQLKGQHREEHAVAELRHVQETEKLKEEVLELKALGAANQEMTMANQAVGLLEEKAQMEQVLKKL